MKKGGVYLASHELHVCATFSRSFFWTDLNLWPEDLAPGSAVLLSGRDDLMNAQQVKAMLEEFKHIKVGTAQLLSLCHCFCTVQRRRLSSCCQHFLRWYGLEHATVFHWHVLLAVHTGYHAAQVPLQRIDVYMC